MRGKVPNYADFSDGQLDQAVEIIIKKKKEKDRSALRKPGNKCQGLSAKIQPYLITKIQQPNATTTKEP